MAFAWIPKATVQAAIGGLALIQAKEKKLGQEYLDWGQAMLTTAVFAICLTAPLGAIFINTLGTKWLMYDGDVNMSLDDDHEVTKADSKIAGHNTPEPDAMTDRAPGKQNKVEPISAGTDYSINRKEDNHPVVEEI